VRTVHCWYGRVKGKVLDVSVVVDDNIQEMGRFLTRKTRPQGG